MKNKSYKKQITMMILSAFLVMAGNVNALKPYFIKAGPTDDPTTKKTITWMTDKATSPTATIKFAKKGTTSYQTVTGKTMNYDYNSSTGSLNADFPRTAYSVTVTGLTPNTTYVYQVSDGSTDWSTAMEFTTLSVTNKFTFFAIGDIQASGSNTTGYVSGGTRWLREVANKYKDPATKPLFTIQVGDLVDREHVYGYFTPWGNVCNDYPEFANTDLVATMGNHEYYNRGGTAVLNSSTSGSGTISKFLYGFPAQNSGNVGNGTYSVDYGNMHIINLDFQGRDAQVNSAYADQYMDAIATWMRNDLKNCTKTWKVVNLHYPIFHRDYGYVTIKTDGTGLIYAKEMRKKYQPIFAEFGVQVVFQGHNHNVSRVQVKYGDGESYPQGTSTFPPGSDEFLSNMMLTTRPWNADIKNGGAGSTVYISLGNMAYHDSETLYLKGDVDGGRMRLVMTDYLGTVLDDIVLTTTEPAVGTITFDANPTGGTLEAFTGGTIGGLGAGNTFESTTGRLIGGTKVAAGQVTVKDGFVYFVATPANGYRVKWFEIDDKVCANRTGNNYVPIDKGNGVSGGTQVVAAGNSNIGMLDNSAPGFVCGVNRYDAATMGQRYAAEIIKLPLADGGNVTVKVEFEKELALYSEISVSAVHDMNTAGAHNFFPSKYGVVVGPAAWWAGNNSSNAGVNDWIKFDFKDGAKNIDEIRLYNRNSPNGATEVKLEFFKNGGLVQTLDKQPITNYGATVNTITFDPITADAVKITNTKINGAGAGYQRVQIVEAKVFVPVLVTSITVLGAGGVTTIDSKGGTLVMVANVLPVDATNRNVTWTVINGTGSATIDDAGLLTAVSDGKVTVRATAKDGSGKFGELEITISGQTSKIDIFVPELNVYPVPFVDVVNISGIEAQQATSLQVLNIAGMTVCTQQITGNNPTVRLGHLPAGVYFFRLESNGLTKTIKAIKK